MIGPLKEGVRVGTGEPRSSCPKQTRPGYESGVETERVSLSLLASFEMHAGFKIERDVYWKANKLMMEYRRDAKGGEGF